jgi:hypothetical protein
MNLQRLRVGEWIAGVSGVVLLVSLFLPWWSLPGTWSGPGAAGPIEGATFERSIAGDSPTTQWSAWEIFSTADVLFALLAILAIGTFVIVARASAAGPGVAAEALLTPFAVAMAVVALVQVLGTPDSLALPTPLPGPATKPGAWIGLASTLGVLAGLLVGMRDERLSEPGRLTDATGVPVDEPIAVETLPAPPPA